MWNSFDLIWWFWISACRGWMGFTAIALIKRRWPTVRVIAHSLAIECQEQALAAGADAFVPKGGRPDALLNALGA